MKYHSGTMAQWHGRKGQFFLPPEMQNVRDITNIMGHFFDWGKFWQKTFCYDIKKAARKMLFSTKWIVIEYNR